MRNLWQDVRYAVRQLRKSPGFTAVSIITLTLGIGANLAMFTLVDVLMLRKLPVREPDRLVSLSSYDPAHPPAVSAASWPDGFTFPEFLQLAREQQVFSRLIAYDEGGVSSLQSTTASEVGSVMAETGDFFSVVGMPPMLGRWTSSEEDGTIGGQPSRVAVISYHCWQRLFTGSSAALGKTLYIDGGPFTVIGVMPKEFTGLRVDGGTDVVIPLRRPTALAQADSMSIPLLGQLRPGVSLEMARAQLQTLWEHVKAQTVPTSLDAPGKEAFLAHRLVASSAATGFLMPRDLYSKSIFRMWMLAAVLLLIACFNLGALMLARTLSRRHEISVRSALGASRPVLIRQTLIECFLSALCGTLAGVFIGQYASHWLASRFLWVSLLPMNLNFSPDLRVAAFAAAAALVTVLLVAVVPSWAATQSKLVFLLKSGGRAYAGSGSSKAGNLLLALQTAFSVVLLVSGAQLVFSTWALRRTDLGLNTHDVLDVLVLQRGAGYKNFNADAYYRDLQQRLQQIPGVKAVGMANGDLFLPVLFTNKVSTVDKKITVSTSWARTISPGYLPSLEIPFQSGRDFRFDDNTAHPPVAIVSRSLASKLFPNRDPVGQHLLIGESSAAGEAEVIGVVADANIDDPRRTALPVVYTAFFQKPAYMRNPHILLRFSGDPAPVLAAARNVVSRLGREDVVDNQTLDARLDEVLVMERMLSSLAAVSGLAALFLTGIGTAGLFSYLIAQRTNEIGLRIAVGAQPAAVVRMMLRKVLTLALVGMALGAPFSWVALHQLSGFLYQRMPIFVVVGMVLLLLSLVSLLAGYIPARRAACVDPMVALRYE